MKRMLARSMPLAVVLAGCGTRTIPVEVRFATQALSDQANAVELYVVDRCADVPLGSVPVAASSQVAWRRGEPSMALSGVLPERFGLAVIARDSACTVVAAGCRDATRGDSVIVVPANEASGPGCAACSNGLCGQGALDAGSDAGIDVGVSLDASLDAPLPSRPDAGAPETQCDCVDQDSDGVIDDGCLAGGNGEVIWQTAFDGPGTEGFRGAALGGDGNVYINGWMAASAMTNLCGTTYTGGGNSGTSWTLAIRASDGVCAHVDERGVADMVAPSSTFASPTPGRGGAWLMTPNAAVELSEGTLLREVPLTPTANFNAGSVRIHPSTVSRSLIHLWPSGLTTLGDPMRAMTLDPMGADLVAELDGTTPRWMMRSPRGTAAVWLDDTRWVIVSRNVMPSSCAMPTGGWRVEIHQDPAMPQACTGVFGLDLDPAVTEMAVVTTASAVWTLALNPDRSYSLVATRVADGSSTRLSFPRAPDVIDTLVHAVAAPDGTVYVGLSRGVRGGSPASDFGASEGYVYHLAADASGIRQLGVRRFGNNIVGISLGPSRVVYVTAGADVWPLCSRTGTTTLMSDGGAVVVGAIQF